MNCCYSTNTIFMALTLIYPSFIAKENYLLSQTLDNIKSRCKGVLRTTDIYTRGEVPFPRHIVRRYMYAEILNLILDAISFKGSLIILQLT